MKILTFFSALKILFKLHLITFFTPILINAML